MRVSVNVLFSINTDQEFSASLTIPGELSAKDPFKFNVEQVSGETKCPVVDVAVVDSNMVRVAVAPPKQLLETAKISDIVKSLDVVVEAGTYDQAKGEFIEDKQPQIPEQN